MSSMLDRARRYHVHPSHINIAGRISPREVAVVVADDPVLAALVEYYEASEAYDAWNAGAGYAFDASAFKRKVSARAVITKPRDRQ